MKSYIQLLPISTLQDPEKEIVKPAIELTRAVILAALKNNVRRVVVTSSGGAIFSFPIPENKVFTAQDWNMQSSLSNNPYFYSKRLAEEEAWKLYQENKEKFELVVVNPVYVLGPLQSSNINTSVSNVKKYLLGEHESIQAGSIAVVDVRDVAIAHVLPSEKEEAVGKRLICCGSTRAMSDIPKTIKEHYPQYPVSKYTEFPAGVKYSMDTQPLKELGLTEYRPFEETIKDTVQSLIDFGLVEKK
ncbi:hypothetical protein FDP41_007838 [Naegleria fowleri]|uniref:3-beta hydroxysteroid dehydrogenase/isomerase domain-containing protein n=1 Tax=Naegleria fowleri TaxID=5763 RepID=A0A6A5C0G0_NAEFO|nr:uncharacterized protein FDP41_007838 [Naegleria fowleri]KAF0983923.1 hypothetical protein FDP41_007838 [Naegleria fowleri]